VRIQLNYDLLAQNTFRMKVSCACYVEYETVKELEGLNFDRLPQPLLHIGAGSNLLFTGDFPGTVLHSNIEFIKYIDMGFEDVPVMVGAGVVWDHFVEEACRHGLWGAENLSLIPGEVGAAAVQNIGAYGVEVKDTVHKVQGYILSTRNPFELSNADCQFGYRNSIFKQTLKNDFIITYVWFQLSKKQHFTLTYQGLAKALQERELPLTLRNVSDCVRQIRDSKLPDPQLVGNGGSFFKNPVVPAEKYKDLQTQYPDLVAYDAPDGGKKLSAGQLIEKAGWKGKRVGNAGTWKNQALVLVNYGGATPKEVLDVAETIIKDVKMMFNVTLEMEINRI
jgi:UDP-N-acetylmuramate dehydrogenase